MSHKQNRTSKWHAPHPYAGPNAPRSTQAEAYTETGTGPDDGHDRPDQGGVKMGIGRVGLG